MLTNLKTFGFGFPFLSNITNNSKDLPFLVINTDKQNGRYVKDLAKLVRANGLTARFDDDDFSQVENLGGVVFVKNQSYDYYFISANRLYANAAELQKELKHTYDLVEDEAEIKHVLKNTYALSQSKKQPSINIDRAIINAANSLSRTRVSSLEIGITVEQPRRPLEYLLDRSDIYKVEAITIYADYVKIGFNTYDIWVDMLGREFILHPDAGKLFVKKDRFGRQYLAA